MPYTYEYPRPAFAADCVIFGKDETDDLKVLLIKRGNDPFQGHWALPGGFVDENEAVEEAANRELAEETGVTSVAMKLLGVYSKPGRDPRGWVISVAFFTTVNIADCTVVAGDDATQAEWVRVSDVDQMAFDHLEILQQALAKLG